MEIRRFYDRVVSTTGLIISYICKMILIYWISALVVHMVNVLIFFDVAALVLGQLWRLRTAADWLWIMDEITSYLTNDIIIKTYSLSSDISIQCMRQLIASMYRWMMAKYVTHWIPYFPYNINHLSQWSNRLHMSSYTGGAVSGSWIVKVLLMGDTGPARCAWKFVPQLRLCYLIYVSPGTQKWKCQVRLIGRELQCPSWDGVPAGHRHNN